MSATATQISSKERVNLALAHKPADRIPRFESFWGETIPLWQQQGMPEGLDVHDFFGYDMHQAGWVNGTGDGTPNRVIEETDEWSMFVDSNGAVFKYMKGRSSTPEHVHFTVNGPDAWRELKARMLAMPIEERVSLDLARETQARARRDGMWFCWAGVECFELIKDVVGHEILCCAMAQQPDWAAEMFETVTDIVLKGIQYLDSNGIVFDGGWIYGDIAYNHGPFCSPRMYRSMVQQQHRRLTSWFKERGQRVIYHTDGDFRPLIEPMLEVGIDCFQPLEAKANIDVRELKAKYGHRASFMGNIDIMKLITNDLQLIENEIASKIPVAKEGGGYIYHSDHSIAPGVTWQTYQAVMRMVEEYGRY